LIENHTLTHHTRQADRHREREGGREGGRERERERERGGPSKQQHQKTINQSAQVGFNVRHVVRSPFLMKSPIFIRPVN
jgi:hypothetical protein